MKKPRTRSRKCKLYDISLVARGKKAQTGLSNLVINQPHPTMEGLYYVGLTKSGAEHWKTADEIADRLESKRLDHLAKQSKKTLSTAAKRKALSKKLDREADDLLTSYRLRGMDRSVWNKLERPIKERLIRAMPNIVHVDDADRVAREVAMIEKMEAENKATSNCFKADMEAKMARAEKLQETLARASEVKPLEDFGVSAERKPLTQQDLNDMSNSRYELPECYSAYDDSYTDTSDGHLML